MLLPLKKAPACTMDRRTGGFQRRSTDHDGQNRHGVHQCHSERLFVPEKERQAGHSASCGPISPDALHAENQAAKWKILKRPYIRCPKSDFSNRPPNSHSLDTRPLRDKWTTALKTNCLTERWLALKLPLAVCTGANTLTLL